MYTCSMGPVQPLHEDLFFFTSNLGFLQAQFSRTTGIRKMFETKLHHRWLTGRPGLIERVL